MRNASRRANRGFTLIEVLVALAVITLISLLVLGALAPWLGLKQSVDTERKLQDVRQGFVSYYDSHAMRIETLGAGLFGDDAKPFVRSVPDAEGGCEMQQEAFEKVSVKFSESPQQLSRDGYANPWCIFISDALSEVRDGVPIWYRNIAIVSTGRDSKLDPETKFEAGGNLVTGGDDLGVVVSGFDIQYAKVRETMKRMNRVGTMYETYFTTRFLANSGRDITRYYFSTKYDTTGTVASTGGAWAPVGSVLNAIGVSGMDAVTPWEQFQNIELNNETEGRTPVTSGTGMLPYTATLRARLPGPAAQAVYATHVVVGNY